MAYTHLPPQLGLTNRSSAEEDRPRKRRRTVQAFERRLFATALLNGHVDVAALNPGERVWRRPVRYMSENSFCGSLQRLFATLLDNRQFSMVLNLLVLIFSPLLLTIAIIWQCYSAWRLQRLMAGPKEWEGKVTCHPFSCDPAL